MSKLKCLKISELKSLYFKPNLKFVFIAGLLSLLIFPSSAQEAWTETIVLQDYMKRFVFPEELISYEIDFPGTFPQENLKLSRDGVEMEYQLGEILTGPEGNLLHARLYLRTGLGKGEKHTFLLEEDQNYNAAFQDRVFIDSVNTENHTAVIVSNNQQVKVPYGEWSPGKAFSEVPAPVLEISTVPGSWVGPGKLKGGLNVDSIRCEIVEDGNLFLKYRIRYRLSGGKIYEVLLTARHNERYITIDEKLINIEAEDNLSFQFSYTEGVNPDARMTISNAGYRYSDSERWPWCGHYNEGANADDSLPYHLGQWSPHSATSTHATLFWNDTPEVEDAVIFSVYRIEDWKTSQRYVWSSGDAVENLYFYQKSNDKYMETRLSGEARYWALSIIRENEENPVTIESQDGSRDFYWKANRDFTGLTENKREQKGGGPEIRLVQKLTDFSLDWVKDLTFEWDEDLEARFIDPFHDGEDLVSYEEYINSNGVAGTNNYQFVERSGASYLGGAQPLGRDQPGWFPDYAISRKNWTPEQRMEVRAILIHWISCLMQHDAIHPHQSMISGHPNFIIETLYAGMYCNIFPNHPDAPLWKEKYLEMWDEYLNVYVRHNDPENYALSGRHTECITTYSRASLRGVLPNIIGFREYDGTDISTHPVFRDWIRWHMYALVTAAPWKSDDLHTYTPPQGAHAREVPSSEHSEWHDMYFHLVNAIRPSDPELADNFLWALTRGEKGTKPSLESALFADYGAILRYDFGGPDEAYVNIQQINNWSGSWEDYRLWGSMNYRWGDRGNGLIYYAADDRIWSWNGVEDNGDNFNIDNLPVFEVDNTGLLDHKTDGILYNFGPVQFYRANGSSANYLSRDVMMVRNDYLGIYDNVREDTEGSFNWTNPYWELPAIYAIQQGSGDNLHVVESGTQKSYLSSGSSFPLILEKENFQEYLFMSDEESIYQGADSIAGGTLRFTGRSGFASDSILALFEGEFLSLNGAAIRKSGGNFGFSAIFIDNDTIKGRISGRSGGELKILPPAGFNPADKEVHIIRESGIKILTPRIQGDTIIFDVDISVKDGYYIKYSIVPAGALPDKRPNHPDLSQSYYELNQDISVVLNNPSKDSVLVNPDSLLLKAHVEADTISINKLEFYMDDQLIGTTNESPWVFNWKSLPYGEFEIYAKAISENRQYNQSEKISLIISDGSPEVEILTPEEGQSYFVIDTILLSASAEDYDGSLDSVSFFAGNELIGSAYSEPYNFKWTNPPASAFEIVARAYDDSGKIGTSGAVNIFITGFQDAANPDSVAPGLIREYYEGYWGYPPDFSGSYYLQKDISSNFNIADPGREDGFAFRFEAYLKISQRGKYEFFTSADDGSMFYLGNNLISNASGSEVDGVVLLDSGFHKVEQIMYDYAGPQSLSMEFTGPDGIRQIIPDSMLFRSVGNAPQISILNPLQNASYNEGDSLHFRVSASDENRDIYRIDYYDGEELIASVTDELQLLEVDSLAGGNHLFTAVAYDLSGLSATSEAIAVNVNLIPKIKILQPLDSTEFTGQDSIRIEFTLEDENIQDVKIYLNEVLTRTLEKTSRQTVLPPQKRGSYYLRVMATDIYDQKAEDKIRFSVVNVPPQVSIIKPDSGAVFKTGEIIEFQASVTDPDEDVYKVAFFSENIQIGPNAGSILYNTFVSNLPPGDHTINAKAFDRAGAVSVSDAISITVTDMTGLNEQVESKTFSVYPNPLDGGNLNIRISSEKQGPDEVLLVIKDILGRVVYHEKEKFTDGIFSLPSEIFKEDGVYYLSLHFSDEVITEKIIVENKR